MVLPEYLVSFDYVLPSPGAPALSADEQTAALLFGAGAEIDPELLRLSGNFIGMREPLLDYTTLLARMERNDDEIRIALQSMQSTLPKLLPRSDLVRALEKSSLARLRSLQYL